MSRLGSFLGRVAGLLPGDLGPSVSRSGQVHPDLDTPDTDRRPPYGASGTINQKGYLQTSEYNSDLQGMAAIDVYERMRRSDPSVRETLWHMFGPIINAVWAIEPPDDPSDEEREQAAMASAAMFDWLEQPWTEVLEHALTYLTFGHSVFEPMWQAVTRSLTVVQPAEATDPSVQDVAADAPPPTQGGDPAGAPPPPLPPDTETKTLPPRQFTTWRKFSPRLPRTLWRWNTDEYSELVSVTQTTWLTKADGSQGYNIIDIPAENLMIFTHEKWGDEWTGISILRSAYKPWVMKEMIERIAGMAYERHGVGYLIGYIPRERETDDALRAQMGAMLADLKQDAYAVMPGPKQMSGSTGPQGYLVEILTPPGGLPNFEPILQYYRSEIAGAMLARFKELGHASTGARATADVQSAVWYNALHTVARYVESQFDTAIRRLIDLNYTGVQRYPKMKASGIEARNLLEFAQAMGLLVDAELLAPDLRTRQWARTIVDAPREDMAETRARALFKAKTEQHTQQTELAGQTQLEQVKAAAKSRGVEDDSSANGGRARVTNAEEMAEAIAASNRGTLALVREIIAGEGFGARTSDKLEKAIDALAAHAETHPPTVTFAEGAFKVEVAAPSVPDGPHVEIHVTEKGAQRIIRNSAGEIVGTEPVKEPDA